MCWKCLGWLGRDGDNVFMGLAATSLYRRHIFASPPHFFWVPPHFYITAECGISPQSASCCRKLRQHWRNLRPGRRNLRSGRRNLRSYNKKIVMTGTHHCRKVWKVDSNEQQQWQLSILALERWLAFTRTAWIMIKQISIPVINVFLYIGYLCHGRF